MTDDTFDPAEEIAGAYGLPSGWGSRLRGETVQELAADAAELASYLVPARPTRQLAEQDRERPSGGLDPDGIDDRDDDEGGSSRVIWR